MWKIVQVLLSLLSLRTERMKEQDRGDTIASVTALLGDSGRDGTVISRQHNDEWAVTLGSRAIATHPPEQN